MEVLLFHITNLFCVEIGKFAFLWGKTPIWNKVVPLFYLWWRRARSEKTVFFTNSSSLNWFWLISMAKRIAKNEFCIKQRHIFPTNRVIKQLFLFFTHAHNSKFWLRYLRIYFDLSLSLSFFLPFFYISSFLLSLSSFFL